MHALHALWKSESSGTLHLWGETSEKLATAKKPKGRQFKIPKPLPHPFAIEEKKLKELITEISGSLIGESINFEKLAIRLPSANDLPAPSPQLIRDQDEPPIAPEALKSWHVPSAVFEPGLALDFLLSLPNQSTPAIALGASIRYWAEAAKFAIELVTRQNFFPVVLEEKNETKSHRAAWSVYLSETDFTRMETLAKAMPPVCRAASSDEPPAPQKLVLHFLNQTVDHFVRQQLSTRNIFSKSTARRRENLPLPEAWLQALSSSAFVISAPCTETEAFLKQVNSWLEQIRPSPSAAPFRTCFRLDSPENGDSRWGISFHLQAVEDRSLMIPSEKVWASRGSRLTFLKRKFENPQERLLADLAKASRVFPMIEGSLKTARPSGLALDTPQAYQFLRETAPLLEQSGFGVLLPVWWQKPALRLGVKLNVRPKANGASSSSGEGLLGMDGIVAYNWQIALGDQTLSPEEFEKLAGLKVPLVKVRGQWVELKPEEIEKAIAFFKKRHGEGEMRLREALRLGLSGDTSETGLQVIGFNAQGWVGDIIGSLSDGVKIESLSTPETFHGELRPYQVRGFSWLTFLKKFGLGACLADDMGLGKTIQFIALLLHERRSKLEPSVKNRSAVFQTADQMSALRPTLLICPTSVVGNWQREIQRFAPSLRVMIHHGVERLSEKAFAKEAQAHDVVISTYALAHRDETTLATMQWDSLVLDEAQNIKNTATKQTQALRRLQANYRVALTGTPVENRLSELWSIMEFLNPGYLGSAHDFRGRFAVPIERYRNSERAQALKNLIQPFVLRRLKTDATIIQDLPEKNEMKVFCNLTAEQASLYEAVVKEMLEKIAKSEGIERKGLVLATLMKLKQVCNHPTHFLKDGSILQDRSGKLTRLREMLEEALSENDKALLFTQFTEMGTLLRHYLQESLGAEALFLHGGTPKKQRDAMVQRFQEQSAGPPLFILSLKAGGVGLNLTAANQVFHFDRWWNPAVENQATDRAFRIGQKKNVQVYKFVCLGTLEERIDRMIESKKELAENVVGTGEGWLTELSTDELREVFALSRESV